MSCASDQKLFCAVCSAFSCYFDEFVGEKVVSPSYSSAILVPSLWKFLKKLLIKPPCDLAIQMVKNLLGGGAKIAEE